MIVGFDTETHLARPGNATPRLVCLTLAWDGHTEIHDRATAVERFAGVLEQGHTVVAHQLDYDLGVLVNAGLPIATAHRALAAGQLRCTKVQEQLAAIAAGRFDFDPVVRRVPSFSLDYCMVRHTGRAPSTDKIRAAGWGDVVSKQRCPHGCPVVLGVPPVQGCEQCGGWGLVGSWRLRYAQLDGVPLGQWPTAATEYAIQDAVDARALHLIQCAAPEYNAPETHAQTRWAWALHLTSIWGPRTDPTATDDLARAIHPAVVAADAVAVRAGVMRDADGIPRAMPEKVGKPGTMCLPALRARVVAAYAALGTPPPTTPKGAVQYGADVLIASKDPDLVEYGKAQAERKLLQTYVPLLRQGHHHPIVGRYRLLETGRASQSPSLQTGPRSGGYRPCFVPRPGYWYAAVDYAQAEMCAFAQLHIHLGLGDDMARAIAGGVDLHIHLASEITRKPYAVVQAAYQAGEKWAINARNLAKVGNFGRMGGLGARGFVPYAAGYGLDVDIATAQEVLAAWDRAWVPGRMYLDRISQLLGRHSTHLTVTQYGSNARVRGRCTYTQAANTLFQGLVADIAKEALWRVQCARWDPCSPLHQIVHPWVFVHDEIIAEVPADPEVATRATEGIARIMVDTAQEYAPDVVWSADMAVMTKWQKGAKEHRNAGGYLVPA